MKHLVKTGILGFTLHLPVAHSGANGNNRSSKTSLPPSSGFDRELIAPLAGGDQCQSSELCLRLSALD